MDAKGRFLSESEIDISNCQIHMPNHYLKFEILKLSSITVECCISVSVLNLIHQESNHPIMFLNGKIQMTKFKIVKQHICLAMKMLPIFF